MVSDQQDAEVFGPDVVKSKEELVAKIKEDAEKQFKTQADQQLLNDVTEYLVENTKFDLPIEFLKKWLAVAGEKPMTPEQASEEFEKSEESLEFDDNSNEDDNTPLPPVF